MSVNMMPVKTFAPRMYHQSTIRERNCWERLEWRTRSGEIVDGVDVWERDSEGDMPGRKLGGRR